MKGFDPLADLGQQRWQFILELILAYFFDIFNIFLSFKFYYCGEISYAITFWVVFSFDKLIIIVSGFIFTNKEKSIFLTLDILNIGWIYPIFAQKMSQASLICIAIRFAVFREEDILLAIFGGLLISLATTFNLIMKGRVSGVSGILFTPSFSTKFVIFDSPDQMIANLNYAGFIIAGFFGGIGTKMANGCTSGHGVCGLPRFSKRSCCSILLFLASSFLMFTFRYYVPFLGDSQVDITYYLDYQIFAFLVLAISSLIIIVLLIFSNFIKRKSEVFVGLFTSILFCLGLGFGGMFRRSKIYGFLSLVENRDPNLMFLLGIAVFLNILLFNFVILKKKQPILSESLNLPQNTKIDLRLIMGSIIFGLSWGFGGLCLGSSLGLLSIFSLHITISWFISFLIGQKAVAIYDIYQNKKQQQLKVIPLSSITIYTN
ncbi:hypothetical protein ABPG72_011149 [Tetrahymena utriculariae]